MTGDELEHAIGWDGDFIRLIRQKHSSMVVHSKTVFMSSRRQAPRQRRRSTLPVTQETIVLDDGDRSKWLTCGGGFGQCVFVRDLPDIDWVPGGGGGVTLDVPTSTGDQRGLLDLLQELTELGWTTEKSRWSIQQAETTWHGVGTRSFAEVLPAWKERYRTLQEIHHTEEFCYVDECDDLGF